MAGISKKRVKTKDGVKIKYTISYYDINGKQHTSGIYDTIKEAKRHLGKFENIDQDKKNITYGQLFNKFFKKAKSKYADSTLERYTYYYKKFFQKFDSLGYSKINSISWQDYFNIIESENGAHIAQGCLKLAKATINYAMKHDLVEYNIFNKIEKIETPKPDINHLTIDELLMVLEECKKSYPKYYAILYTFAGTGAREGEIFALTKDDLDFEGKTIKIDKQFTKGKLKLEPKTSSSYRKIDIFDELVEVLKKHIETLDNKNPLLFPNSAGNYHNASNFRERFFYKLLNLCGIKKRVRVHDLRGTYTDLTLSSGLSVKFTQNQLGHSRSETTLNIYARNSADMRNQAMKKIDSIFSQKCEQNVSKIEKSPNKKIIQFPKRSLDSCF